jgi:hypothetical protein
MKVIQWFTLICSISIILTQNITQNETTAIDITTENPPESSTNLTVDETSIPDSSIDSSTSSPSDSTTESSKNSTAEPSSDEEATASDITELIWGVGPILVSVIIVALVVIGIGICLKEQSDRKLKNEFPPLLKPHELDRDIE